MFPTFSSLMGHFYILQMLQPDVKKYIKNEMHIDYIMIKIFKDMLNFDTKKFLFLTNKKFDNVETKK